MRSSPRARMASRLESGRAQPAISSAAAARFITRNAPPGLTRRRLELMTLPTRLEYQLPPERYRSGHNGADSKSDGRVKPARGFESHPLRHPIQQHRSQISDT